MSTNADQPAYPSPGLSSATDGRQFQRDGLTKREAFAMAAMQARVRPEYFESADEETLQAEAEGCAQDAVRIADALLAELAKSSPTPGTDQGDDRS